MQIIILLLESLLYYFCIYTVMKNLYGHSASKPSLNIILLLIYALALFLPIDKNIYLTFVIVNLANLIFIKLIFKKCYFHSIISTFIMLYSCHVILSAVTVFLFEKATDPIVKKILGLAVNCFIILICLVVLKLKSKKLKTVFLLIPINIKRLFMISVIASDFLINLVLDYGSINSITQWNNFTRISIIVLIAIIGSVFPVLIANSIGKSFYNKQSKMFEKQIEIQAKHYQELAESNLELRRFKHDYKNMLIGVKSYIESSNTAKALELLNKGSDIGLLNSSLNFDTGNGIVDAILFEKQKKAEGVNSTISFEGAIPNTKIAPTDLCVIFGNTLDNAIEACEKLPVSKNKNTISVVCKSLGEYIFVNISNPTNNNSMVDIKNIKTSKKDTVNHGFGLYSLEKSVKKYNGSMKINCENNVFSVDLELTMSA